MSIASETGTAEFEAHAAEFLLHDFDHLAGSLLSNEESGEKRVQFFLTVVTVVFGIVGLSFRRENIPIGQAMKDSWGAIAACLAVLQLLGISTLMRLVHRNIASDKYKAALVAIRRSFLNRDVAARSLGTFDPHRTIQPRRWWPPKGGWVNVIGVVNAAIVSALAWVVSDRFTPGAAAPVALLVAVGGGFLQVVYVARSYRG
jgi:hypothetical protein